MEPHCRSRSDSYVNLNEIYFIGEQVRQSLHKANLVKDRKYHLRTYKKCIVGCELIDWLVKCRHCASRDTAVDALAILQKYAVFHHVCDDHMIKDQSLFYRFRRDDESYKEDQDLTLFYKALELYQRLSADSCGILRSYQQDGELFRNAFQGCEFVDYLLEQEGITTREQAVLVGRRLLENDTIRHVTDDYHFRDDSRLLFRFTLDFSKQRSLDDIFNYVPHCKDTTHLKIHGERERYQFHTPQSTPKQTPELNRKSSADMKNNISPASTPPSTSLSSPEDDRDRSLSGDSGNCTDSETSNEISTTRSVLLRHATVSELESPDTPYVKHSIKIMSDSFGFGFVLRGNSPCYVQTVDPMGPAAVAGLKVRQFIYSVNGKNVLRSDHTTVGKLIMQCIPHVNIVIMTHKRDACW